LNFSELQILLKKKLGIEHLADIARELDVSPQAVSNWKARNKVPYKYIVKIRKELVDTYNKENDNINDNKNDSNKAQSDIKYVDYIDDSKISISDILLVIARQFKIIFFIPLVISIYAIIYTIFFLVPIYESTAKIMSSSGGNNVSQGIGIAAQLGINIPISKSDQEWVYPEIIKSRTLAKSMLKRKFDTEKYGNQQSLLKILTYGNEEPDVSMNQLIKSGVNSFISMIDINQKGNFYELTISALEPVFARDLAIALIDELDTHQRDYNKKRTSEARKFIEKRIDDTRLELEIAEEDLKNFNDSNRRIENSPSLQLERQRLSREVAVLTGVYTTLKQQLETTKIEEVRESDYVLVLDPPEAPLSRSSPNRKKLVLLAGILGLCLGLFIGFIKEYLQNSEKSEQEKIKQIKPLIVKNIFDLFPKKFKRSS